MIEAADRRFLTGLFAAAVRAADPGPALRAHLPAPPKGRTIVIGAGKASSQMARVLEQAWDGPIEGMVVTRYGYATDCARIRVVEAGHPVPDAAGLAAADELMRIVSGLTADDLVIALISGGGSALLPCPTEGLTLADEIAVNRELLASGLPISAMNAVRAAISRIKGGRLAAQAAPAKVVSFIVSDVPGDAPHEVASGPTIAPDWPSDALAIVKAYGLGLQENVLAAMRRHRPLAATDAVFAGNSAHIVASARLSLEAAAAEARAQGVPALILSDAIEGEAKDVGLVHAALAREIARGGGLAAKPVVLLSGGETSVTLGAAPPGRGGRNSEFLLSLACGIAGEAGIVALAADTDGIDGSEDNAGAFADGGSVARMRAKGCNPDELLARHDAWSAFAATGDLFVPGPTGTNVNDFRAILVR